MESLVKIIYRSRTLLLLCLTTALLSFGNTFAAKLPVNENSQAEPAYQNASPFTFEASYIGDLAGNLRGGLKRGSKYLGMANLRISFDTETGGLWKGGTVFINAANTHGGMPSQDLTGDFQGISNIESGNQSYLHEAWYRHSLGRLTVIAGLQDLCSEFAVSENGSLFLNGSFGVHSTISSNVPSPVFPLTALGAQVQYRFSDELEAKIAAYDGQPDDFEKNPYNVSWRLNSREGIFSISEVSFSTNAARDLRGTYRLGAYYHNHLLEQNETESGNEEYIDNYGMYIVADQELTNSSSGRGLGIFAQIGASPAQRNENSFYLGTGLNIKGLLTERNTDILGIAAAHAGFHGNRRSETTIEVSYKTLLTENIFIQPDVQYIINPAGTGTRLRNTLAGIIRFGIDF